MKNTILTAKRLAFLLIPLLLVTELSAQSVNSFDCPLITKRNNGNGSASSGPGTFINEAGNPSNPVAPNVTGTSYQNVPYNFSQKTGNITFQWITASPSLSMGLPIINRVWLTSSGVTTLMSVKFGPPAPAFLSGGKYYTFYHFYNQNIPPQGTLTLEFVDPVTGQPIKLCQYDLITGNITSVSINCAPTIATQPANQRVCGNTNAIFSVVANGASTYQWQISNDGFSGWANISNNATYSGVSTSTLTIANPVSLDGKYFRVVATGAGTCGSTNSTAALLIAKPQPTGSFASTSICGSGSQSLTLNLTGSGPWSVSYSDGTTTTTRTNINSSPLYITGTSGKTYTVTTLSDLYCTNGSPSGNIAATIYAPPTVTPSNATICYGASSFSLSYTSTGSSNQYTLTKGVRQVSGFSNLANINPAASPLTITIPSNTPVGTYDFNLSISSSVSGCSSVTVPFTLTVVAAPAIKAASNAATVCIGSSITLTASPAGLSSYAWRAGTDPTVIASTAVATPTLSATTKYYVTGTNAAGCSATDSVTITGQSGPSLTVTAGSSTICSGNATLISSSGSDSYTWSPATGLNATVGDVVIASPASTTTYTVTSQNVTGCQSSGSVTITVNSVSIAVTASATICAGTTKTLTATGGSSYLWYPSTGLYTDAGATVAYTGTSVATVYAKPTATTIYYVQGTSAEGCKGIATSTVTISPAPVNGSSTTTPLIFCTQGTSSFPLTVTMTQAITSATWYYSANGSTYTNFTGATVVGGGATATPSTTGSSPTVSYICTLSGYGAAGYTGAQYFRLGITGSLCTYNYDIFILDSKSLGNNPAPAPTSLQTTICSGNSSTMSIGSLAAGSTAQWQSSPNSSTWTDIVGATSASYTASPISTTYYRVQYNGGTGNCGASSASLMITVASALSANTVSPSTTCTDGSSAVTLTGSAITGGIFQWQQSTTSAIAGFSDVIGATSQNYTLPTNIVSTPTWYRRIASTSNCSINTSTAVAVYAPIASNQITNSLTSFCVSTTATLLNVAATNGGDGTYSYQWKNSTDGTSFSNIVGATSATYTTPVTGTSTYYQRTVTSGGCTDISNRFFIRVFSNPTVGVTSGSSICAGTTVNLTGSGASTYSWSPSTELSASTGPTVLANATSTRTYTVTGTDGNNCSATATVTLTVTALPSNPTLSSSGQTICYGSTIDLTSKVSSGGTTEWFTAPEANGLYSMASPSNISAGGTYYVFAKNGSCYSSGYQAFTLTVSDTRKPAVNSTALSFCSPATADLTALQPVTNTGTSLGWYTVPSNPVTTVPDATAVGSGTYYLYAYSSAGSCFGPASDAVTVTINTTPSAPSLTTASESSCAPASFDLTDNYSSTGGYSYQWYNSSTIIPANVVGVPSSVSTAGNYYLVATSAAGCQGPASLPVLLTVNAKPSSSILETVDLCGDYAGTITVATDASSPTYQWEIGTYDGSVWNWSVISNGGAYSGATTAALSVNGLTLSSYGDQFRCTVTKTGCATTSNTTLLATEPLITTTTCPQDSVTFVGNSKSFTVAYSGIAENIQWQVSTTSATTGFTDISDGAQYSGVNTPTLQIVNPTLAVNGNYYRAVISNGCSSIQCSNGAKLSVFSTLPVQWLNFSAQEQNGAVILKWSTAEEFNSREFYVQHSIDGINWIKIGSIPASVSSSTVLYYSFLHSYPQNINFYRIQSVDQDEKYSYTRIIRLNLNTHIEFTVYPNPVTDGSITVQTAEPAKMYIYDASGKLVFSHQLSSGVQHSGIPAFH